MALFDIKKLLSENSYPGRGIVVGTSADGKKALIGYFIMGRSENSRNRVFERFEGGMRTKAFDESKLSDPSLIIYNPYLSAKGGNIDIVTNGDQTNTIFDFMEKGDLNAFENSLATREFEPDFPNYTPRISAALYYSFPRNAFTYKLSILKSANGRPVCNRYFYNYTPGEGSGYDAVSFVELSADERKMLSLSMQGCSLNEIADIMAKSTNTIKFYRRQIFYKFGVNNISEAIAYALENTVMQDDKIIYVKINSIDKSKQNKRFSIGFASCWAVFVAFIVSIFKDDTD